MEKTLTALPMHIAFCSDSNYVMPAGVAMISICENNRDIPIVFHFVLTDEGASEETKNAFITPLQDIADKYNKQIAFYTISCETLSSYVCTGVEHVSTTGMARIFLPSILPSDIQKVLYLDCDLVVTKPLQDLWQTPMAEDCPLGAVEDAMGNLSAVHCRKGLPDGVNYFNSGVLLMNLSVWRRENLMAQILQAADRYHFPMLDQDCINFVLQNRILRLPFTYNGMVYAWYQRYDATACNSQTYEEILELLSEKDTPVIIHYAIPLKPWKDWRECPWQEEWDKYKQLSIWKDTPKQKNPRKPFDATEIYSNLEKAYWGDPGLMQLAIDQMLPFYYACHHFKNKQRIFRICFAPMRWMTRLLEVLYQVKNKKRRLSAQ